MRLSLIVATDREGGIGQGNDLPWHLPSDLKRFRELTTGHTLVVGSRTHDSIVQRLGSSLPGRTCVVLTSNPNRAAMKGVVWANAVDQALELAVLLEERRLAQASPPEVFVIGGRVVYEQLLPLVHRVYQTLVDTVIADCDTFMPAAWLAGFVRASSVPVANEAGRDQFPSQWLVWERAAS